VALVDDVVAGGWPREWIEVRCDVWSGVEFYRVRIEDRSCSDGWTACWAKRRGRWRFSSATDGWDDVMSLTQLRSFVCNGPTEVV
jgi:hypothetical protein